MRGLLEGFLIRQLRRDLRQVDWIGEVPELPPERPVVLYANHAAFHDALVLGFLARHILGREPCVWMEEYDRLPLFRRVGALPFPRNDPSRRSATIRRTIARMRNPSTAFVYFPEGELHPFEEGLQEFPADVFSRLERAFPPALWWPVALRVSSWNSARPTATLIGGTVELQPMGNEWERLAALLRDLGDRSAPRTTLLEGRRGPEERWGWAARLLERHR